MSSKSSTGNIEHETRSPKVVFINSDGRVCLAPSLSWFSREFHMGKGVISDMTRQKRLSYREWYFVNNHWLPAIYKVLEKPPEWFPGVVGVYNCNVQDVSMVIQNLTASFVQNK